MKTLLLSISAALVASTLLWPSASQAQPRGPAKFEIKKIAPAVITTPDYQFQGDNRKSDRGKWLEVEVEFAAIPEFTDELTFRYYIQLAGTLLVGEVTHVNVPAGANVSVMYIAPGTIKRALQGKGLTGSSIENIAVEITEKGALSASSSLKAGRQGWWQSMQQIPGLVINKNQTPFAPLYWDRYPEIKSAAR